MVASVMSRNAGAKTVGDERTGPSDQELVEQVRAGDQAAFRGLVERYSSRIWTLVSGMVRDRSEVEDIVQDVFFKVYRKLPSFEGKSSFYTWLYRVAFNTATDHLKKKRLDRTHSVEDIPQLDAVDEGEDPTRGMDRSELRRRLAEAMSELPDKYRDILVLREYEECSYEDIAEILQCSKGTVESRLFRARARLREKMKRYMN